jgi:hypothetical protein
VATEPLGIVHARNALPKAMFCLAAAVTAAAVIDPTTEGLANAGVFGTGNYTDHSNLDVIPALLAGAVFSLLFVAGVVRRVMNRRGAAPDWLRAYALASDDRNITKLLPVIFALQLIVLWSMETLEQIAVAGHPLGGAIWLGGPFAVSLLLHAAGCLAFTWLLSRTLRWSARTIVDVVTFIRQLFCTLVPNRTVRTARAFQLPPSRFFEPILARLNGRAPPPLSA